MTLDLDQLERLAKAATPGPWKHEPGRHLIDVTSADSSELICRCSSYPPPVMASNALFIAACSPDVILALVARVREAETKLANLCKCINRYPDHPDPEYSRQRCPVHQGTSASALTPSEPRDG